MSPTMPTVVITDFQIFNKSVKPGQGDHPDVLKTQEDAEAKLAAEVPGKDAPSDASSKAAE